MRRAALALVPLLCAVLAAPAQAQPPQLGDAIPGRYIVTLDEGRDPGAAARSHDVRPRRLFRSALTGFAAELSDAQVRALRRSPAVDAVEPDRVVTASATQYMDAAGEPWGLDRADQRALPLSRAYGYGRTASRVTAYVIDTGLAPAHPDFGGRAANVYDALGGTGADCNGHGTHVAGTIGGAVHGVAKGVQLRGVRVLGCDGSGTTSAIIAAVDWVRANAVRPAVANMSLGGSYSSALNRATANLAASGVFVAAAAGNEGQNACNVSPASTSAAYTVAASDRYDRRAPFSNHGSCVDAYAPGVGIRSAWHTGGVAALSGTSMASPHAAGVATLYKDAYGDASSATIESWLNGGATANLVRSNVTGTPNRLLYKGAL